MKTLDQYSNVAMQCLDFIVIYTLFTLQWLMPAGSWEQNINT